MREGVPDKDEYDKLLKTKLFRSIEEFSNAFHGDNSKLFSEYGRNWVTDPLHQWSRQWEYPFIYQAIERYCRNKPGATILDAGSGYTFFPYLLARDNAEASITCVDADESLSHMYDQTLSSEADRVRFISGDLRDLPLKKAQYDLIYCVSVLEHTRGYADIVKQFHRVAKPSALLIITFDISLSGLSDIPVNKSRELLAEIRSLFPRVAADDEVFSLNIDKDKVLNTKQFLSSNKQLLPWRLPLANYMKDAIKGKFRPTLYKRLTIFCGCFGKTE